MKNEIILEQMKKIYPDSKIVGISNMRGLSSSKIFLVKLDSGKKIIFKIYPKSHKARLEKEINILKELESEKIPSPRLIHYDIERLFLIEEYIEGKLLYDKINEENFDLRVMISVGKKLAELHKLPIKDIWQDKNKINNKKEWIKSVDKRNHSNLKDLKENNVIFINQLNILKKYMNNFSNELENYEVHLCPIHGDYNPKNILIEGIDVKGIFDFEIHRIAHNLNDLGIVYYWYKFYDKEILFLPLLKGYTQKIRITEKDKLLIEKYYAMQVIGALSFLIKNNLDGDAVIKLKKLLNEFLEQNKKNNYQKN